MSDLQVEVDYQTGKYSVLNEGKPMDLKLPEAQAAVLGKVVADTTNSFINGMKAQYSKIPPGLEELIPA